MKLATVRQHDLCMRFLGVVFRDSNRIQVTTIQSSATFSCLPLNFPKNKAPINEDRGFDL